MSKQLKTIQDLLDIKHNSCEYFNICNDGGVQIWHINDIWILFEIPLYGGNHRYVDTYNKNNLQELIDLANSFT
jgi:hypothetical protein